MCDNTILPHLISKNQLTELAICIARMHAIQDITDKDKRKGDLPLVALFWHEITLAYICVWGKYFTKKTC